MMIKLYTIITICIFTIGCKGQNENVSDKKSQDIIIEKYLKKGAWKHHYLTKEWEGWINKGLKVDSTIAYLWQQKALPYWKQKKYQLAISYYDKAVEIDRQDWLSRLGFLKCIFAKDYNSALDDFTNYIHEFGSTYEQDHSLEFYMGICYLQLSQYENAINILKANVESQEKENGVDWVHYLDRYYLGIVYYEANQLH